MAQDHWYKKWNSVADDADSEGRLHADVLPVGKTVVIDVDQTARIHSPKLALKAVSIDDTGVGVLMADDRVHLVLDGGVDRSGRSADVLAVFETDSL